MKLILNTLDSQQRRNFLLKNDVGNFVTNNPRKAETNNNSHCTCCTVSKLFILVQYVYYDPACSDNMLD
jgi:hypothetical protein